MGDCLVELTTILNFCQSVLLDDDLDDLDDGPNPNLSPMTTVLTLIYNR